jgi:PAS domain S-box-containing protein/putative nucleotidyltransferase with HDIG domain
MPKIQKILIAEDRSVDRRFLRKLLASMGYDVVEAVDGMEGLEMVRLHKPDLIISDALMPRMDGFNFLRAIKNDESLKHIPFIFYSAVYTGEKDAEFALSLGAMAYIEKPAEPVLFMEKLKSLMQDIQAKKEPEPVVLNAEGEEYLKRYSGIVAAKLRDKVEELEKASKELQLEITEHEQTEQELRRIEWLLSKDISHAAAKEELEPYIPYYGDLAKINTARLVLDLVGESVLSDIANDYLAMLETSAAVYEKNGDYALSIFSSSWCRMLDQSSRKLCAEEDNKEALRCGKWVCHESCWTDASRISIEKDQPVDIECDGGIRLYAVPIHAGREIVGSINFGYGDPPTDGQKLQEVAERYKVSMGELRKAVKAYQSRPPFIVDVAKKRLLASARLIGEIIVRKQAELALQDSEQQIRLLLDSTAEAIYGLDLDGNCTLANIACLKMLGYDDISELLGKNIHELIHHTRSDGSSYPVEECRIYQAFHDGEGTHVDDEVFWRRDGSSFPVSYWSYPVYKDNQITGSVLTFLDITEQLKARDALAQSHGRLRASLEGTIAAISKSVEARDPYTSGHQNRVAELATAIAHEMGLDEGQIQGIHMGASIHDIGKIYLPAEILSKPTKLTAIEYSLIQSHPQVGYDILRDIDFPWPVADIAHQHHERSDGSGYPQGLKGDEICLEARIVAVADVVEAMASHRPYRPALGIELALDEIRAQRGKFYDPEVADTCLKLFAEKIFSFES